MNADSGSAWPDGIRRAGADDLRAIEAIEADAFEPSRRSSRRALARALRSGFQRVLVMETDGAVVGYLVFWPYLHTWRIYNLATARARRGRGVAGQLIGAVVEAARVAGVRRVVLESRDEPGLVGFYRARGFRPERFLPDYYSSGEDAIRMTLNLG